MSYKYDRENGPRNANQIGADVEDYNENLYKVVNAMKKTKDVREAINIATAFSKGIKDYQKYIQNKVETLQNGEVEPIEYEIEI